MKKQLFTLLLLLGTGLCTAMAQTSTLVLTHADGKTTEVELNSQPRIQLSADKMTIKAPLVSLEYAKEDVVRFHYKNVANGISNLEFQARYHVGPGGILFYGVSTNDRIALYGVDGTRLPGNITTTGSNAFLSLSHLPRGVYVISFNGKTFKIIMP